MILEAKNLLESVQQSIEVNKWARKRRIENEIMGDVS